MDGVTDEVKDIRNSVAYNIITELEKEGKLTNTK
jgi:hypothetical protein